LNIQWEILRLKPATHAKGNESQRIDIGKKM